MMIDRDLENLAQVLRDHQRRLAGVRSATDSAIGLVVLDVVHQNRTLLAQIVETAHSFQSPTKRLLTVLERFRTAIAIPAATEPEPVKVPLARITPSDGARMAARLARLEAELQSTQPPDEQDERPMPGLYL